MPRLAPALANAAAGADKKRGFDAGSARSVAEFEIQPRFDFLNIQTRGRRDGAEERRREIQRFRAKAEINGFNPPRPVSVERIFEAGAGGPAGARQRRARCVRRQIGQAVLLAGDGKTALAVDQEPVEGGADASGDRRCPLRVGGESVAERIRAMALDSGPAEIAFEAEHEPVELGVEPDLTAAEKAAFVEIIGAAGERIVPRGIGKAAADMAADVKAAPVINRWCIDDRSERRGSWRRWQIGSLRAERAGQRGYGERGTAGERARNRTDIQLHPRLLSLWRLCRAWPETAGTPLRRLRQTSRALRTKRGRSVAADG